MLQCNAQQKKIAAFLILNVLNQENCGRNI